MKLNIKNAEPNRLRVYVEPSTDEIVMAAGDMLTILSKFDAPSLEVHYHRDSVVIWIPRGQSADFLLNGQNIETLCSQFVW